MSRIESLGVAVLGFAVAFGVFTVIFASAPSWGGETVLSNFSTSNTPVARVVVDKTTCLVGQDVTAAYEYYNPYLEDVTFSPPSQIAIHVEQAGEKNEVGVICNISWTFKERTIGPGESFTIYNDAFTAEKPGNMTITINGLTQTIIVSSRSP